MRFSEKQEILVVGPWNLNNSYLGVSLELEGFKVDDLEFQDFADISSEELQNRLCLIDLQCEQTAVIFSVLGNLAKLKKSSAFCYALFNVCPDHVKPEKMLELSQKGLAGVFFDGENLEMICRGVRIILKGELWFPRKLMAQMILNNENGEEAHERDNFVVLTLREKEVLAKLASGLSNQEIAEQLFISIPTVKMHASRIYEKINVTSRLQAALWLAKNG